MHRTPYQHVIAGAGDQGVGCLDNWARDHASLDLRVPPYIRCERHMVDDVHYADHVDSVTAARARIGRLRIGGEPVDLPWREPRIVQRRVASINRQQAERLLCPAADFGITDANDRGLASRESHLSLQCIMVASPPAT